MKIDELLVAISWIPDFFSRLFFYFSLSLHNWLRRSNSTYQGVGIKDYELVKIDITDEGALSWFL